MLFHVNVFPELLFFSGRERSRQKDKSSISKLSQKRTPSAPPFAPPPPPKPAPPPPARVRDGPKRIPLPSRQVLDVDGVCEKDPRPRKGEMNCSWEKQMGDVRNRRVRIRRGARQTSGHLSNKPVPVKATETANASPSSGSKHKATFV